MKLPSLSRLAGSRIRAAASGSAESNRHPLPDLWRRGQSAFTMVEIAICIAVVAFALVAIIGVMPTGLQVQRQNREDTIIEQEGNFWLEAIRSGSRGLNYLTNYVEVIHVETLTKRPAQPNFRALTTDHSYRSGFENGEDIIGLLSIPRYYDVNGLVVKTPSLFSYVRALTGSAAEKTPHNDFGFMYRLTPELLPYNAGGGMNTNFHEFGLAPAEAAARSNLWVRTKTLGANLYQLKLTLQWPVYPRKGRLEVGNNRKVFRTLVGGSLWTVWTTNVSYLSRRDLFFVQPSEFLFAQ